MTLLNRLSVRLAPLDRPWLALLAIATFIAMNAIILPQVGAFETLSGGLPVLELPTSVGGDLRAMAAAYPPEAVAHYLGVLLPLDIVYPATAGLMFMVLLTQATRRAVPAGSWWHAAPLLGALMVLTDWMENLGVLALLTWTDAPWAVDVATQAAIALKFGVGMLTVLLTLGWGGWALIVRGWTGGWPVVAASSPR